ALAACVITQPGQFLFTCAVNTTTTPTSNVVAPGSTSAANQSSFLTGVDVVINPGIVVNGNGLHFGIISPSQETLVNNGAVINTNALAAQGLSFVNTGAGGDLRYVGNGSASTLSGFGLSLVAVTVEVGTPNAPIVPAYSGPSSITSGGLNIVGLGKAEAYFSGGTIAGGMQFAQAGSGQPGILTLAGHTTITADTTGTG